MCKKKTIGVLALQGAVEPHKAHIEKAGGQFQAVKKAEDFSAVDAFILPGGESTTMIKLIERFDLWDVLADQFAKKPVWGICAGAILLADKVQFSSDRVNVTKTQPNDVQKSFGLLPMTVERNGYGRQIDSHQQEIDGYPVSFIRAPIFINVDESLEVLAEHEGKPAWVKKGHIMASAFHPELTLDFPSPMHQAFVDLIA